MHPLTAALLTTLVAILLRASLVEIMAAAATAALLARRWLR